MKRSISGYAGLASACLLVCATSRCVTDHDSLAKRDGGGGADAGGGQGGKSGSGGGGSGGTSEGGGAGKYVEPVGRNVVTFMHGVVDAERVAFCFARDVDGEPELVGDPTPKNGLDFAEAFSVESLPDLDFEDDAIVPYVIGGDLELIDGLDCEQAVALAQELTALAMPVPSVGGSGGAAGGAPEGGAAQGGAAGEGGASPVGAGGEPGVPLPDPPALRVGALPELPPSTLKGGYSYLLVAEGCLGGPWYVLEDDPSAAGDPGAYGDDDICGAGYSGGTTLSPALVVLSRETADGAGFQALHASRGSGALDFRVSPPPGSADVPLTIASGLSEGSLEPRQARSDRLAQVYGVSDAGYRVELVDSEGPQVSEAWQTLFDRAGLDTIEDGKNYVLVALGPRADIGVSDWWNLPTVGIVPSEPPE